MSESTSFVQLLAGFFLLATGAHATCPIELSPSIIVVREGDPASAVCRATGTHEGMGWESSQGGISLQKHANVTWAVESLKDWELTPICFINPLNSKQCAKDLKIVLYTFPENISIRSNSPELMRDNEEYTFTCDIHRVAPVQNVTVKWYRGDTVILTDTLNNDNGSKKPVSQSADFTFSPTKKDNGTRFRCEVHMDLRPEGPKLSTSSEDYFIKVISGISLTCPSTYTARENEPHDLTCTVDSNRESEVVWYKDGEEVRLPERLTRSDAGQYLIVASNVNGGSSVNLTLDIIVKYPPSQIVELEDSEGNAGNDLRLKCSSRSDPRPTYSWDYYHNVNNVIVSGEDGVSYLQIHNATAYNTGNYTCRAFNDFGSVSKTVRVTVKDPPSQIVELEDSEVNAGNDLRLKCSSRSNPRPTYSWDYYHAGNVIVSDEDGVSYLQIHNATAYNTGNYTCRASNEIGSVSRTARVTVKGEIKLVTTVTRNQKGTLENTCVAIVRSEHLNNKTPDSVSIRSPNTSVLEGEETQLQCDIINVAPVQILTVRWRRGNETIAEMENVCCQSENASSCGETGSPGNVSSIIKFIANKSHNGVEFVCETRVDLQPGSPKWNTSSPVNITVSYKPIITELQREVPILIGYPAELVCKADGFPPPDIMWKSDKGHIYYEDKHSAHEAGTYTCNASNPFGSASHEVRVILTEDYLPLIAGFVAVMVVAISIIFLCIYSIYYKNTKMRRYSLKNPNFSTQNGNVAHNGWEVQFPMHKLP